MTIDSDPLSALPKGKYKINRLLGKGAFSKVYLAELISNGQQVVIKLLDLPNKEAFARLDREIRLMKNLPPSSNIVVFFEGLISTDFQTAILVSEFVDGPSLKELVETRNSGLPEEVVVSITQQLCSGVKHLHGHRILHRDIKPSNIFISSSGRVKLGDFGLVISALYEEEEDITSTGVFVGTLLYLSPEIISRPKKATIQSDLYSLGVTILYMILGHNPFRDVSILDFAKAITNGSVFRNLPESFSPHWRRSLATLLAPKPEDRISSVDELISVLKNTFKQPEAKDIHIVANYLRKIDHTKALSFEPPRVVTSAVKLESGKPIPELMRSLGAQISQIESTISDITASFSRDNLQPLSNDISKQPADRIELSIDKTFEVIRSRLQLTWKFSLIMTIILFVLFTSMVVLTVIFGVVYQKSLWGIVFGSSGALFLLTVLLWRPMDKMLLTTMTTQQLEFIQVNYQRALSGTHAERREAFRDVSSQIDSLIARVSLKLRS